MRRLLRKWGWGNRLIENVLDEGLMFWSSYKRCGKLHKRLLDTLTIGLLLLLWSRRRAMVDRRGLSRSFHLHFPPFIMARLAPISGAPWDNYSFIYEKCAVHVLSDLLTCSPVHCSPSLQTISLFLSRWCSAEQISERRGFLSALDASLLATLFFPCYYPP